MPTYSTADELFIVGACQALLVGTGELYRPWLLLDVAPVHVTAQLRGAFEPGQVDVVRFDGSDDAAVTIEFDGGGSYRVVTTGTVRRLIPRACGSRSSPVPRSTSTPMRVIDWGHTSSRCRDTCSRRRRWCVVSRNDAPQVVLPRAVTRSRDRGRGSRSRLSRPHRHLSALPCSTTLIEVDDQPAPLRS